MNRRSRSTLFLIEQLIVVAVFAICAAACVRILAAAYLTASDTKDVNNAILIAENAAECYKAVSGDIEKTVALIGGNSGNMGNANAAIVYYDEDWFICEEDEASCCLRLLSMDPGSAFQSVRSCELSVWKLTNGQLQAELVAFTVAAHSNAIY